MTRNSLGRSSAGDFPLDFCVRLCASSEGGATGSAVALTGFSFFFFDPMWDVSGSSVERCFRFLDLGSEDMPVIVASGTYAGSWCRANFSSHVICIRVKSLVPPSEYPDL